MVTILTILLVVSMLATLGVMFAGMLGLARENGDPRRSNKLMRLRVTLQGVSIGLFVLLVLAKSG
ncbi:twin transmembrane helix small protein [Roseomonas sp. USHLN139]|uniref:twin transmembrane helix small protein n=1 Tax=Roseomonas sp. USHLN139 TaxID=3081298 RepID=UPI003B02B6E6